MKLLLFFLGHVCLAVTWHSPPECHCVQHSSSSLSSSSSRSQRGRVSTAEISPIRSTSEYDTVTSKNDRRLQLEQKWTGDILQRFREHAENFQIRHTALLLASRVAQAMLLFATDREVATLYPDYDINQYSYFYGFTRSLPQYEQMDAGGQYDQQLKYRIDIIIGAVLWANKNLMHQFAEAALDGFATFTKNPFKRRRLQKQFAWFDPKTYLKMKQQMQRVNADGVCVESVMDVSLNPLVQYEDCCYVEEDSDVDLQYATVNGGGYADVMLDRYLNIAKLCGISRANAKHLVLLYIMQQATQSPPRFSLYDVGAAVHGSGVVSLPNTCQTLEDGIDAFEGDTVFCLLAPYEEIADGLFIAQQVISSDDVYQYIRR